MNKNHHIFYTIAISICLACAVLLTYQNFLKRRIQMNEQDTFNTITSCLRIYEVKIDNKPLIMCRWGSEYDGGYVVPKILFEKSDVMLSYGIANDISFESSFSQKYGKESFCFDGGVESIDTSSEKCYFFSECIGDDNHLYSHQKSSRKLSSYSEHIKRYKLENKKIFLKMDIEGAEFDVFDDILKHADNITGIVLEIHFEDDGNVSKARKRLSNINKNFLLVHLHGNNYCKYTFFSKNLLSKAPRVLELTYVNRNLVDTYKVSNNQKHPTLLDKPNNPNLPDYEFEIM